MQNYGRKYIILSTRNFSRRKCAAFCRNSVGNLQLSVPPTFFNLWSWSASARTKSFRPCSWQKILVLDSWCLTLKSLLTLLDAGKCASFSTVTPASIWITPRKDRRLSWRDDVCVCIARRRSGSAWRYRCRRWSSDQSSSNSSPVRSETQRLCIVRIVSVLEVGK